MMMMYFTEEEKEEKQKWLKLNANRVCGPKRENEATTEEIAYLGERINIQFFNEN